MNTLTILHETFTSGYNTKIIDLISIVAIISAIYVIVSKNPIISVLFLIGLFLSMASYLIIIGISFIGLSYLLVYVGAVSILFLFILMLINVRISELLSDTKNSIPLVFFTSISLNSILYQIIPFDIFLNKNTYTNTYKDYLYELYNLYKEENEISFITNNNWDNNIIEFTNITSIGNIMYTNYSIWIILTSIILLLAMVGSIVITIKQYND